MLHPPDALGTLPADHLLGPIDLTTLPLIEEEELTEAEKAQRAAREAMPPAEDMLLVQDFEGWAEQVLSNVAWAYYRSAADHEVCESAAGLLYQSVY
jgi:L-lactate dehydrogenase (cytochrome)